MGENPPGSKIDTALGTPSCTRERTAPLVAIDDVEPSSARVGPCGDIVFEKTDGSLWLRSATGDGALVSLAAAGSAGELDATGTYFAFTRTGQFVVRQLMTGAETVLPHEAHFGFDAATQSPIVFTCADGVQVLHADGALGAIIPNTAGVRCGRLAPYGKVMLGFDDTMRRVVLVDLARESASRLDIDYVGSGQGTPHRRDDIALSRDGGVILHQIARWTPCGDTECSDADGFDLISTITGKRTHAGHGHGQLANTFDFDGARGNALVEGNGRATSIDTATGDYVERTDATLLGLRHDGTLVLQRSDQSGTRVSTARPGSAAETTWLTTGSHDSDIVTWPTGKRAIVLERPTSVKTDTGSNWGGSYYGDLVVKDEAGAEIGRYPHYTDVEPVAFHADGAAIVIASHYRGTPPAMVADSAELDIVSTLVRIAPDGSLHDVANLESSPRDLVELGDGFLAAFESSYDGLTREYTASFRIYDLTLATLKETIAGHEMRLLDSAWSAPTRVVALEERKTDELAKLWHGVPRY